MVSTGAYTGARQCNGDVQRACTHCMLFNLGQEQLVRPGGCPATWCEHLEHDHPERPNISLLTIFYKTSKANLAGEKLWGVLTGLLHRPVSDPECAELATLHTPKSEI